MILVRLQMLATILLGAHYVSQTAHSFTPLSLPTKQTQRLQQIVQGSSFKEQSITTTTTTTTSLFSSSTNNQNTMGADFDYQELKINLRAMKQQKLTTANQLEEGKRNEMERYVRTIVKQRPSPVPLWEIGGDAGTAKAGKLPGTKWRLSFSTQAVTNESLPAGVQIQLDFVDERRVDYSMEFTKTFGLSKLTAESSYQVDSSPVNPGWVTYTYEKITTDVLGFKNVGIGMMGLLQGRGAQIQTVYFDDELWIETGKDGAFDYFNVYTREDDDDDWQQS